MPELFHCENWSLHDPHILQKINEKKIKSLQNPHMLQKINQEILVKYIFNIESLLAKKNSTAKCVGKSEEGLISYFKQGGISGSLIYFATDW